MGAVVLMTGFGLAACGSDDGGSGGGGSTEVGEESGTELTEDNFFAETTKAQLDAGSSHMTMSTGGQADMTAEGDVVISEDPKKTRMSMTMSMEGVSTGDSMEMRLVDGVFYMNMGEMTGGKFTKMDLADESNPMGAQFNQMIDNMDPARQLEAVEKAVTGFEQKGEPEKLDGVEATPYVITVDTAKVMEQFDGAEAGASQMPEEIVYTMYIGPDNLPRRISTELMGQKVDIDYSKWGEDVSVEAPADDEISDQDPFGGLGG